VTERALGGESQATAPHERFVYDVAVRWSDMDAYGHVNNARFLTLYEEARVAMFFVGARAYGLRSFEEGIVIARHEVDYLKPVDYRDPVRVEIWIAQMRAASFTVAYEMYDGDALVSRARSVCVPYNLERGFPRRLTDAERGFLQPYVEA
jgi:acyl-CoA thioester hydrolase